MNEDEIQINVEPVADGIMLQPSGDIDLACAGAAPGRFSKHQASKPARLIIDLSAVPYMDSSGVATLVESMQIARRHGGKLILFGMQARVRSIFEIARLHTIFTICDTMEAALKA